MRTVDVAETIDGQKVSYYQCLIAFMAWLTLFLDGMDNQSIAYVAPALTEDWGLARGALRTVFSTGVFGVALGALFIGPLADRYGRKLVTVLTVIYVGVLSLIVTQVSAISAGLMPVIPAADNLNVLAVLRFFTGLGLGAVVPLGVVIVNEFAPRRRRAAMVTLMGCGYAMGAASGGFLASYLVPAFGWEAQFYVAAGLTVVMAAVLWLHLPESIRLLTIRGRTREIAAILRRINPALVYPADTQFVIRQEAREASANRFRPLRLFMENRAATTALIWLALLMNTTVLNYLNNWLPTLAVEAGLPQVDALRATPFLQVGGMLGVISLGFLADRFGFFRVLMTSFALGAICIGSIGWAGASFSLQAATIFAAGFFNIGTQITLAALAATLYPTDIRSTGVSWAHGVARIGSISSVMLGGTLLALNWELHWMYYLMSVPMIFGSLWMLLLWNVRSKTPGGAQPAEAARGAHA
jgi:MFS transporter, AAHS family, 4-hydroxybenzoate transporter